MVNMPPRTDLSETDFEDQVIQLAHIRGWKAAHFRPALTKKGWRTPMKGDKGFPDLVLARDGEVVVAELKSERGTVSDDQAEWLEAFGLELRNTDRLSVYVWRPSDLPEIQRVLAR